MAPPRKYSVELRERAVRMVFELREQTGEKTGTIARVAGQLGVHREALRTWIRQAEVDGGQHPGTTTTMRKGSANWNAKCVNCGVRTRS